MASHYDTNFDHEANLLPDSENGMVLVETSGELKTVDNETDDVAEYKRHQWSSKREYLLSAVGYCVGVGNLWRFPYMCNRNGGGEYQKETDRTKPKGGGGERERERETFDV